MSMSIDTRELAKAGRMVSGTVSALEKARVRATNRVANKTRTAANKEIRNRVRLKSAYVNQHLRLFRKATNEKPVAIITARRRPTRLARYGAKQLVKPAKSNRARGDASRGIPAGKRQAGVSVLVNRSGSRRRMRKAFLVPLRNTGLEGVFIRDGGGKNDIRHLYGPSVDQLFKSVRQDLKPLIRRELVKEYKAQMRFALSQEVKS